MKTTPLISCIALIALTGCLEATQYQPANASSGFTDSQQGPQDDTFRVTFNTTHTTTYESAQTYWLYRCAEMALQQGYTGFVILTPVTFVESEDEYKAPPPDYKMPIPLILPLPGPTPVLISNTPPDQPLVSAEIRLIKGSFTANPPHSFNAAALRNQLEPWVHGKKCGVAKNICPHAKPYLKTLGERAE